jgi:Xaa-Pro aminopeptidase
LAVVTAKSLNRLICFAMVRLMRHAPIDPKLFVGNRQRLSRLMLANSLAVVNSNDVLPTNADGSLRLVTNSDLFYLTGVEQEESLLLLYPDAHQEEFREILFVRQPTPLLEIWEGHKLREDEAKRISGVKRVEWLSEFPGIFRRLMCECEHVYLNSNEHKRAVINTESREARFVAEVLEHYPLHDYQRLARLLHRLRVVKSPEELRLIGRACSLTGSGFDRVLRFVRPGVNEAEVEAEFAHEFIRKRGGFAYTPIVAGGLNACALHYIENSAECRDGDLLLLDVAAQYGNYNSDMTRTIPINGRFTRRQRQVYNAVLRVFRQCVKNLRPGKLPKVWQQEAERLIEAELLELGVLTTREIRQQKPGQPAFKRYFMHGVGHPIGLDVHDVGHVTEPMQAGWVMTVEPAIYLPAEGFAVRLENTVVVGETENIDLMEDIPIEAEEIEAAMNGGRGAAGRNRGRGRSRGPKNLAGRAKGSTKARLA